MWLGRFGYAIPALAIAGSLAAKAEARADRRHAADAWSPSSSACCWA